MESSPFKSDLEENLSTLQNNIHHIENKIRSIDAGKRADTEDNQLKIRKNDLEIKKLSMEIKELQVRMEKCQKSDETLMLKAFNKYSRDFRKFQGKSAKEAIQLLDAEVLDLENRKKSLEHQVELNKRILLHNEEEHQTIVSKCKEDFENDPTEFHSVRQIRELETEQQMLNQNIEEGEIAEGVLKRMKEQLEKNRMSHVELLLDVENQYNVQQRNTEKIISNEDDQEDVTHHDKKSVLSSGEGDFEASNVNTDDPFNRKKVRFSPNKASSDKSFQSEPTEPKDEMQKMIEMFEAIKTCTGVTDIKQAEARFLEQKSMHEDLLDLKKKLAKSVHELKTNKKQLESNLELMRGAGAKSPKRELENEMEMTQRRQKEQERRRKSAEAEFQKISLMLDKTTKEFQNILHFLGEHYPQTVSAYQDMNVTELGLEIEKAIRKIEITSNTGSSDQQEKKIMKKRSDAKLNQKSSEQEKSVTKKSSDAKITRK